MPVIFFSLSPPGCVGENLVKDADPAPQNLCWLNHIAVACCENRGIEVVNEALNRDGSIVEEIMYHIRVEIARFVRLRSIRV